MQNVVINIKRGIVIPPKKWPEEMPAPTIATSWYAANIKYKNDKKTYSNNVFFTPFLIKNDLETHINAININVIFINNDPNILCGLPDQGTVVQDIYTRYAIDETKNNMGKNFFMSPPQKYEKRISMNHYQAIRPAVKPTPPSHKKRRGPIGAAPFFSDFQQLA